MWVVVSLFRLKKGTIHPMERKLATQVDIYAHPNMCYIYVLSNIVRFSSTLLAEDLRE